MIAPEFPAGKYPFVGIALAGILGIWLADFHWVKWEMSCALAVGGLLCWLLVRNTVALLTWVALSFFLIHGMQYDGNRGRLLAGMLGDGTITVQGTGIVDSEGTELTSTKGSIRSSFQLRSAELIRDNGEKIGPVSLLIRWPGSSPGIGDAIKFEGNLFNLSPPRNPGEFDYSSWLARQQIFSSISVPSSKNAAITQIDTSWNIRRWASLAKNRLGEIITRDLQNSPTEASVISAMVLGTSGETPEDTRELFLKTGTLHLFSVSGLHVTMLAAITLFVMVLLRVPRRVAMLLTIPAVFGYALVTGWSASSVRAALMTSALVVGTLMDRPSLSINTLAVACFLILLEDTNQLFATGFQLSFSVVAALILLCEPITESLQKLTRPDPFIPRKLLTSIQKSRALFAGRVSASLGLTLAAWLGSLPLTAYYFSLLSPVAIFSNLVIVPLSFVILSLSVLSLISSSGGSFLVVAFNNANWAMTKILLGGLGWFVMIPAGSMFVGPHWWQLPQEKRLTVLDLGNGGAMVLETGSGCWLIDCGSESDYRNVVRRFLQKRGINQVDGIFLTHGDSAHIGGIPQFRVDFPTAKIFAPQAGGKSPVMKKLLTDEPVSWLKNEDTLSLTPEVRMEVLWPPIAVDSGRADDTALVLKLVLGNETFLLLGDSGFITEAALLSSYEADKLKADWIITGRNRSDPGAYEDLYRKIGAKTLVSTAIKFPAAEQIPQSVIEICQKLKMKLIRMDESGAVIIEKHSGKSEVKTFF